MFTIDENANQKGYAIFGKNKQKVNEDIKTIKSWLNTQKHLPEIPEDAKIKNFLQLNKFDIERTKEKIETYYTIRKKIPSFFENGNPKLENIRKVFDTTYCTTHPKPLDGLHRVIFLRHKEPNVFSPIELVKLCLAIFEIRLFEDCMVDDIIVFDLSNLTLRDATKISPKFVIRAFSVYKNVFSLRLKALHFLNSPFYVSIWMTLMKFVLKPKIVDRVQVHRGTEILKELFTNEDLPKDFGGDGPSLDELNEMMKHKVEEYQDRFDKMDKLIPHDESSRSKKPTK